MELHLNSYIRDVFKYFFAPARSVTILSFHCCIFNYLTASCGSRLLPTTGIPPEHIYHIRYKGMMLCSAMLRSIFTGNCINFGVFSLYGDSSIDDALRMFFEMALDIGRGQFLVYPKLVKSYHDFLEALTQDYVVFVTNLEPDVLVYVLQTPLDGVNSLDTDIVIPACATVDKVVSHMYKRYYGVGSEAISVTSGGDHQTIENSILRTFFEMALDIGRGQFLVYPKLVKSYHDFLEALTQDYVVFVTNLEPDVLVYVLQTLLDGVNSLDTDIVIPACATVDKVVSHMYQRYYGVGSEAISVTSGLIENDNSLKVVREKPEVLQEILSSLLSAVLFDECRCHYSMSRPILGLILLLEDYYSRLKLQLIVSLPPSQQNFVSELMDELTKLPRNLVICNKDQFTSNVSTYPP
ncbi:hypothetical protein M513_12312, partial [Trichuris suis]